MISIAAAIGYIAYIINILLVCWIGHEILVQSPSYFRNRIENVHQYIKVQTQSNIDVSEWNANTIGKREPEESSVMFPVDFDWFPETTGPNCELWQALQQLNITMDGRVYPRLSHAYIESINAFQNALSKGPAPLFRYRYFPLVYIVARNVSEVQLVVQTAIKFSLPLGIESTGDHNGGNSLAPDGILLDLYAFQVINVNSTSNTAYAQVGLTFRQLQKELQANGYHFPGPVAPLSGISQFLLSGASGWGSSYYGTGADNVLSVDVVDLRNGDFITVNATHHSDLFWAIRGDGSGLAIPIAFELQLYSAKKYLPMASLMAQVDPPEKSKLRQFLLLPSSSVTKSYSYAHLVRLLTFFNQFQASTPGILESTFAIVHTRNVKHSFFSKQKGKQTRVALLWNVVGFGSDSALLPHWRNLITIAGKIKKRTPYKDFTFTGVKNVDYKMATSTFVYNAPKRGIAVYGTQLYFKPPLSDNVIRIVAKNSLTPSRLENSILIGQTAPEDPEAITSLKGSFFQSLSFNSKRVYPSTNNSVSCRHCLFIGVYASWKRTSSGAVADGDVAHIHWVRNLVRLLEPFAIAVDEETILTQYKDPLSATSLSRAGTCDKAKVNQIKSRYDPHGLTQWMNPSLDISS